MYHQAQVHRLRIFLINLLALSLLGGSGIPALAGSTSSSQPPSNGATGGKLQWQLLPPGAKLRKKPQTPEIFELDKPPLGSRRPLLLVHGLRGEYRADFRWGKVIKRFADYPDFNRNFKVYLLRYDSTAALSTTRPRFKEKLLSLSSDCGQPVSIMALSLGGSLLAESMQDPQVDRAVRLVLSLAAPFHGSPLFCADWFQYSLYKNLSYPWSRLDHSVAYRLYFALNRNLLQDLRWDNADGCIPDVGVFKSRLPLGPSGNLTVWRDGNDKLAELTSGGQINKKKFITYAGYLLNPYLLPTLRRQLEMTIMAPYTFIAMHVPAHLAREHPVLNMLNHEISRVIPDKSMPRVPNYPHIYGLNDGITPVNSAIFLPAQACKSYPLTSESEISRIKDAVDVKLARVFRNIDHLTFVDGYKPLPHASHLLRDQLNPEDGSRTIFDWILSDLMQSESEQLAGENNKSSSDRE